MNHLREAGWGEPTGADKEWREEVLGANGPVVAGRGTYEATPLGDKSPRGIPVFVLWLAWPAVMFERE